MAQIGLRNLYYATITEDSAGNETYGTPAILAKAISAELSVEASEAILYADDGADTIIKEFSTGTLSLGINDLPTAIAKDLFGFKIDDNGVLVSQAENKSNPVAIGFQSKSASGGDRYYWIYRVTFAAPNSSLNTKGESVEFATPSIEGTISRRNKVDAYGEHPWKVEVKKGDTGVADSTCTDWFTAVYEPEHTASV